MYTTTPENHYRKIALISTASISLSDDGYLAQLCKNLSETGFKTDVFATADNEQQPRVINWTDNVRIINIAPTADMITTLSEEVHSYSKRNHIQYDVIHAMDIDAAYSAAILNDLAGTPYIINLESYEREHFSVISQATEIVLHNNAVMQQLLRDGFNRIKLNIITNGFDPLNFFPIASEKARKHLDIKANGGLLVCHKSNDSEKNKLLYDAFALAKERQRQLQIIMLTDAGDNEPVEGINFVQIYNRDLLKYYYAAADLFVVMDCREDGKPNTIYEAMACGTPVLGIGNGMKECITNAKTGFTIGEPATDAIAHKIVHILRDKELMQEMQLNAVIETHNRHTWKRTVRLISGLYKKAPRHINTLEIKLASSSQWIPGVTGIEEDRAIA